VTRASARGSALAIDHGEKRTGFAVADPLRIATEPLEVWHGRGDDAALLEHVAALLEERDVATIVVGYPVHMDGRAGARARAVDAFIARVQARFPELAVVRQDERLTTKEAEELLRREGLRPERRRALRDAVSALVILRDWIEAGEPA